MKRMGLFLACLASIFVFFSVSLAVELTDPSKVPDSYAQVVDNGGKKEIVFGTGAIGYAPIVFNQILEGYSY